MSVAEIVCVVFGLIMLVSVIDGDWHFKNVTWKDILATIAPDFIRGVIGALIVLLPLYFNYWRK